MRMTNESPQRLRWEIICALDIVIELCMVGMSVLLVWNLHAQLSKKIGVVTTFAFRLLYVRVRHENERRGLMLRQINHSNRVSASKFRPSWQNF
jgi:hypothetical protein